MATAHPAAAPPVLSAVAEGKGAGSVRGNEVLFREFLRLSGGTGGVRFWRDVPDVRRAGDARRHGRIPAEAADRQGVVPGARAEHETFDFVVLHHAVHAEQVIQVVAVVI